MARGEGMHEMRTNLDGRIFVADCDEYNHEGNHGVAKEGCSRKLQEYEDIERSSEFDGIQAESRELHGWGKDGSRDRKSVGRTSTNHTRRRGSRSSVQNKLLTGGEAAALACVVAPRWRRCCGHLQEILDFRKIGKHGVRTSPKNKLEGEIIVGAGRESRGFQSQRADSDEDRQAKKNGKQDRSGVSHLSQLNSKPAIAYETAPSASRTATRLGRLSQSGSTSTARPNAQSKICGRVCQSFTLAGRCGVNDQGLSPTQAGIYQRAAQIRRFPSSRLTPARQPPGAARTLSTPTRRVKIPTRDIGWEERIIQDEISEAGVDPPQWEKHISREYRFARLWAYIRAWKKETKHRRVTGENTGLGGIWPRRPEAMDEEDLRGKDKGDGEKVCEEDEEGWDISRYAERGSECATFSCWGASWSGLLLRQMGTRKRLEAVKNSRHEGELRPETRVRAAGECNMSRQQSGKATAKIEMKAQEESEPDFELLTGDHDVIDGKTLLRFASATTNSAYRPLKLTRACAPARRATHPTSWLFSSTTRSSASQTSPCTRLDAYLASRIAHSQFTAPAVSAGRALTGLSRLHSDIWVDTRHTAGSAGIGGTIDTHAGTLRQMIARCT
ncbi:hypothetical protein B0H13DRAFT_1890927 [Mycena leptocephala]|nr:hypothetical protein B0H13DRAFT_1890927 [Mycena leptocephala]